MYDIKSLKFFEDLCFYLKDQTPFQVIYDINHLIDFPYLYVEWLDHKSAFDKMSGQVQFHVVTLFEDTFVFSALEKLQTAFSKALNFQEGLCAFKLNKIQKKMDKKTKTIIFDYQYLITPKKALEQREDL